MDFFSIVIFLILYYIRPQEWLSGISVLKPVMSTMALAIFAMFNRKQGFAFKDIFKTPHDWLMLVYFLWVVIAAPNPMDALGRCYNLFVFYIVTVQALSNLDRIQRFLNWWTGLIVAIAFLALASEWGFDPMNSYDMTHGIMKDRLVLNTSLFDNPNALGHSVVPCLMMLYYACYWRRPVFSKIATIPLVLVALYCIYLTVSKGSFLSAFASLVLAYSFGRPKAVQITIVVLAVTVGYGALYTLPRMNELKKARQDPAIQGRIAAWQFGLDTMRNNNTGVGLGHFKEHFFRKYHYDKAGHSSYVQLGTEMGYTGLGLFLAILYCCTRTLVGAKTTTTEEERIRRILFVLLCSYFVSSWMVDFGFRATYFLMAAVVAAFHRQMLLKRQPAPVTTVDVEEQPVAFGLPRLQPVGFEPVHVADAVSQVSITIPANQGPPKIGEEIVDPDRGGIKWNRLNFIDYVIIAAILWAVVTFWAYIMRHI